MTDRTNTRDYSKRIYIIFSAVLSALFGLMFYFTPVAADDTWYLCWTTGEPGSWEAFVTTVSRCVEHWRFDTGRFANMITAPFLSELFPRYVYAGVSAAAMFVIFTAVPAILRLPWISMRTAFWVFTVTFIIPWLDYLFTTVYCSNYIWCTAATLIVIYFISRNDTGRWGTVALCLFAVPAGWWHEGLSVPLIAAAGLVWLIFRPKLSARQWCMIIAYIVGACIIFCLPAFWHQIGDRPAHLFKSLLRETLIHLFVFNCLYWLYFGVLATALVVRKYRRRLFGDRDRLAWISGTAVFGLISMAIFIKYYNGVRTGMFNQLVSAVGLIILSGVFFPRGALRRVRLTVFGVVGALSYLSIIWADIVQPELSREHAEMYRKAYQAIDSGKYYAFHDTTPMRIAPDLMKNSYMLLHTMYGWREEGVSIVTPELEGLDFTKNDYPLSSDSTLYIIKGNIVAPDSIPEGQYALSVTFANGHQEISRAHLRWFYSEDGTYCTWIIPYLSHFDFCPEVTDARRLE